VGAAGGDEVLVTSGIAGALVAMSTNDFVSVMGVSGDGIFLNFDDGAGNSAGFNVDSASGNVDIFGNNVLINGSPVGGGYTNSNVNTLLSSWGSNTLSTTGNVTAGNFITTSGGRVIAAGNVSGTNIVASQELIGANVVVTKAQLGNATTTGQIVITTNGEVTSNSNGVFAFKLFGGNVSLEGTTLTNNVGNLVIAASTGNVVDVSNLQLSSFVEKIDTINNANGTQSLDITQNGSIQILNITGNITIDTITNMIAGRSMTLVLKQDATGGRTLTSSMKFAGASKTLSTAANAIDIMSIFYDGTNYYASLTKGYA
jgi:hypothetical protein